LHIIIISFIHYYYLLFFNIIRGLCIIIWLYLLCDDLQHKKTPNRSFPLVLNFLNTLILSVMLLWIQFFRPNRYYQLYNNLKRYEPPIFDWFEKETVSLPLFHWFSSFLTKFIFTLQMYGYIQSWFLVLVPILINIGLDFKICLDLRDSYQIIKNAIYTLKLIFKSLIYIYFIMKLELQSNYFSFVSCFHIYIIFVSLAELFVFKNILNKVNVCVWMIKQLFFLTVACRLDDLIDTDWRLIAIPVIVKIIVKNGLELFLRWKQSTAIFKYQFAYSYKKKPAFDFNKKNE
jgi:hypothetical protein